jgi:uncharacterized RDD family membrane protein YckC
METTTSLPVATRHPGVGPRAIATIIDAMAGFLVVGLPLLILLGQKTTTTNATGGTTTTWSTGDPKVMALWLVLATAYYVAFEATVGATPGKLVLGLRVRSLDGGPVGLEAALIRNVLRIVDGFPYLIPYLFGVIVMERDEAATTGPVSRPKQRLGDRAAHTVVTYR